MVSRIGKFIRESIVILSIITIIIGLILLSMGILWYGFPDFVEQSNELGIVYHLGDWNAYLLVIGLIIFGIGVYYLYVYLMDKKFILEEIKTDKRSEFIKKHSELRNTVKRLPSKYKKMLKEKEKELGIK